MDFIKKQGAGFYLMVATFVLALIGLICYQVNTGTNYFVAFGVDGALVGLTIVDLVLMVGFVVAEEFIKDEKILRVLDIVYVIVGALLIVAFIIFVNIRAYYIGTILSYESTQGTAKADLTSALVGLVFYLLATITACVTPFFSLKKPEAEAK